MNANKNEIQADKKSQFVEPRVALSKDKEYVLHFLPGNIIIRKHVNLYKKILDVPFTPKHELANAG